MNSLELRITALAMTSRSGGAKPFICECPGGCGLGEEYAYLLTIDHSDDERAQIEIRADRHGQWPDKSGNVVRDAARHHSTGAAVFRRILREGPREGEKVLCFGCNDRQRKDGTCSIHMPPAPQAG